MFFLETFNLEMKTTAGTDILDLTGAVQERVQQTGVTEGLLDPVHPRLHRGLDHHRI